MNQKLTDLSVDEFTELMVDIIDQRISLKGTEHDTQSVTEEEVDLLVVADSDEDFLSEKELDYYLQLSDPV